MNNKMGRESVIIERTGYDKCRELPSLWGFAIPTHPSCQIGSLQLPLSQGDKTSHQKQTFFSGGNSCVHSTSHNLFFSGKNYSLPQDVFMDPQNWNSNGFQYSWPGSAFIRLNIVATHAVGKTIFWRPEKK